MFLDQFRVSHARILLLSFSFSHTSLYSISVLDIISQIYLRISLRYLRLVFSFNIFLVYHLNSNHLILVYIWIQIDEIITTLGEGTFGKVVKVRDLNKYV